MTNSSSARPSRDPEGRSGMNSDVFELGELHPHPSRSTPPALLLVCTSEAHWDDALRLLGPRLNRRAALLVACHGKSENHALQVSLPGVDGAPSPVFVEPGTELRSGGCFVVLTGKQLEFAAGSFAQVGHTANRRWSWEILLASLAEEFGASVVVVLAPDCDPAAAMALKGMKARGATVLACAPTKMRRTLTPTLLALADRLVPPDLLADEVGTSIERALGAAERDPYTVRDPYPVATRADSSSRAKPANPAPTSAESQLRPQRSNRDSALENERLKRELAELRASSSMHAVTSEVGLCALAAPDLPGFSKATSLLVSRALEADAAEMLVLSQDGSELSQLATTGPIALASESTAETAVRRVLGSQEPVLLDEREFWPEHLRGFGITSGARVAVRLENGEPVAVFGIYGRAPSFITREHLPLMSSLANVISRAFARHAQEERRSSELEASVFRASEERLRRLEHLAALGTYAAGIAHELNNPIGTIALSAEYAVRTEDPERRAKLLDNIVANAQRCGRIVESVLRFAKDETTRKWSVDLNALIRQCVDLVKTYVGQERIVVDLDLNEPAAKIVCNPTEIEQVFVNLLRNAVEAHPGRCRVCIRCSLFERHARIVISDDGPGIAKANRDRVFDPFFSTRRGSGGSGLGLSITHRILTGHGGSIRLRSERGAGATFEIELPLEGRDGQEAAAHGKDSLGR